METIKIRIPLNISVPVTEQMAVEQMNAAINKLLKVGGLKGDPSDFILNYDVINTDAENCVVVEINKENLVDTAHFLTVAGGLCLKDDDYFNWEDRKVQLPKTFSTATIQERLRVAKRDPRQRFRMVITDYKNWWKQKADKIDKDEIQNVVNLFLADLMQMFNEVLPEIQDGKQLQTLLGTNQVSNKLNQSAKDLSIAYRRALNSEEQQGAPAKNLYIQLSEKYRIFLNQLLMEIFPGIDEIIQGNTKTEGDSNPNPSIPKIPSKRVYSKTSDGRIDLFSSDRLKDGRIDLFSKRTSREILKDEELQNRIFDELRKKLGEETFKKMTFDEIYMAVMKEFWKRKRY